MNLEYKEKYLKYKTKYLNLVNLSKMSKMLKGGEYYTYILNYKFGKDREGNNLFSNPMDIIQLTNGNLAIIDEARDEVQIWSLGINRINNINPIKIDSFRIRKPTSITQLSDRNLAITSNHTHNVIIINLEGDIIRTFGSVGSEDNQFLNPKGIIQLDNGYIAVIDSGNIRIQVWDILGNYITNFGYRKLRNYDYYSNITKLNDGNYAISCCVNRNNLYNSKIEIFNNSYNFTRTINLRENIGKINGLIQLEDGNILLCNSTAKEIMMINQQGDVLNGFGIFNNPVSIIKLSNSDIAICDSIKKLIYIYKKNIMTEEINQFFEEAYETPDTNNTNNINLPQFPNLPPAQINTIVEETNNTNNDYKFINTVDLGLTYPNNIINLKNNLYAMADTLNNEIKIFEINKDNISTFYSINILNTIAYKDSNGDNYVIPTNIIKLEDDKLCIIDTNNNRVLIVESSGKYISQFGSYGNQKNQFNQPTYATQLNNKNIAISDKLNNCIKIFDMSGNYISQFGKKGTKNGEFGNVYGIKQLVDDNIVVCDPDNNRIQIFDIEGNYIDKIDETDLEQNTTIALQPQILREIYGNSLFGGSNKFKPYNLIQLDNEDIMVLDNSHNIYIFDVDGNYIEKFTSDNFAFSSIIQLTDGTIGISKMDEYTAKSYIDFYQKNKEEIEQEKEPIDIQDVLNLINYQPYIPQSQIYINYWKLCDDTKFNFVVDIEKKIIDTQYVNYKKIKQLNPSDLEKIQQLVKINIFDTLYMNRDKLLIPNTKPFFIFVNIVNGIRDAGIDEGGLTKTVFYELSKYLTDKTSPFFEIDDSTKLYSLKSYSGPRTETDENLYYSKLYFLGQLFGFAIKLKITIEINLDPILLYQLTHTLSSNRITKKLINKIINEYNPQLLNKTPYVCYDENLALTKNLCIYNEEGEEIYIDNLEKETNKKISISIKEHNKSNKYFIKGFRQQIDINKTQIDRLPLKKLDELICGISDTNLSLFNSNINFVNFTQEQENILREIINQHIQINGEKKYLETLLLVMTGSNKIPATGFIKYKLRFEINSDIIPKPIDIHSCFNHFIINPQLFNDYSNSSNKKETELYMTFDIKTLNKLSHDFSSA